MHFEELSIIHHSPNHFVHIVGTVGLIGDNLVEEIFFTIYRVGTLYERCLFHIILGEIAQEATDKLDTILFGIYGKLSYTALSGMYISSTKLLLGYIFARYGLYHFWSREEHVARTTHHYIKVCKSRRIHGTTGTRAKDSRDLGDHTRGEDIAFEDFAKATEGVYSLLNACTTRVVKSDYRCAHLHGKIHHFTDLLCEHFSQGSTQYGKVLCEYIYESPIYGTTPHYYAIAKKLLFVQSKIGRAMEGKHIDFFKTTLV